MCKLWEVYPPLADIQNETPDYSTRLVKKLFSTSMESLHGMLLRLIFF